MFDPPSPILTHPSLDLGPIRRGSFVVLFKTPARPWGLRIAEGIPVEMPSTIWAFLIGVYHLLIYICIEWNFHAYKEIKISI
jgi:hypothetical protein